jgi:hypothetical protein
MAPCHNPLQRLIGHKTAVSLDIRPHWRLASVVSAAVDQCSSVTSAPSNMVDFRTYRLRVNGARPRPQEDS